MTDAILVLNAGSSSLKYSIFRVRGDLLATGQVDGIGATVRFIGRDGNGIITDEFAFADCQPDHDEAISLVLENCKVRNSHHRVIAVGHRVVHGGLEFATPVRVDEHVVEALEKLVPLAPLHQPHNLAAIRAVRKHSPDWPQVACFDTAFHRTQPEVAQRFGLPRRYSEEGVRRYGFHGLSYEYIASVLPAIDPRAAQGRAVVAHLGNGASLCALAGLRSIATTMSFTPADGLLMGTRTGALDPGVLLYMMQRHGLDHEKLAHLIYHESGLLGVSGISSDMRELLARDEPAAKEAIELFVYRLGREIGSMAAALGGLDALVFTGGIGANAPAIRERVCRDAAWLDVRLDEQANKAGGPRISTNNSGANAWVIPTNEELMIAQHTRRVLGLTGES